MRRHAEGRKIRAQMDQTEIYLDELDRLYIYEELADTWAWVALGPERQQAAAIGAPEGVEGAHAINEGV
ncbi:hypothetical protein Tco_0938867 [Tanacetum coccineum]|uniref:Uncharacterized protein n=1 Tax=Tanacetum coccineum TaxID=301880 RepID=A0ABQ5DKW7_9ASTR